MRLISLPGSAAEPRIALLTVGSAEWHYAWRARRRITRDGEFAAVDPGSGAAWQYLESVFALGRWWHQFRHLRHPVTRRRWYVRVPARKGWKPTDPF